MVDTFLCWIESHPGLAAWVQASGTLIALLIAMGIPWIIHKNERNERATEKRLQGQGVALLIGNSLRVLDGELERAIVSMATANIMWKNFDFESLQVIKEHVSSFWLMGAAGGHALKLVDALNANRILVAEMKRYMGNNTSREEVHDSITLVKENLQLCRDGVADTLAAMEVLLGFKS